MSKILKIVVSYIFPVLKNYFQQKGNVVPDFTSWLESEQSVKFKLYFVNA